MNLKNTNISSYQAFPGMQCNGLQFGASSCNDLLLGQSSKGKQIKILNVAKKGIKAELDMNLDYMPKGVKMIYNDTLIAATQNNFLNFYKFSLCNPTEDELVRH